MREEGGKHWQELGRERGGARWRKAALTSLVYSSRMDGLSCICLYSVPTTAQRTPAASFRISSAAITHTQHRNSAPRGRGRPEATQEQRTKQNSGKWRSSITDSS